MKINHQIQMNAGEPEATSITTELDYQMIVCTSFKPEVRAYLLKDENLGHFQIQELVTNFIEKLISRQQNKGFSGLLDKLGLYLNVESDERYKLYKTIEEYFKSTGVSEPVSVNNLLAYLTNALKRELPESQRNLIQKPITWQDIDPHTQFDVINADRVRTLYRPSCIFKIGGRLEMLVS